MADDHRVQWVAEKVCTALGVETSSFYEVGGEFDDAISDLQAVLNNNITGGCLFYCLTSLREVETEGESMYIQMIVYVCV